MASTRKTKARGLALAKLRAKRLRTILDFDAGIWELHGDDSMTCLICKGREHDSRCWFKRAARTARLLDEILRPEWYRQFRKRKGSRATKRKGK